MSDPVRAYFDRRYWHPLDHRIGTPRCIALQFTRAASLRTHARYWWHWGRGPERWRRCWHTSTRCRFGRHAWATVTVGLGGDGYRYVTCAWCPARPTGTDELRKDPR